MSSPSPEAVRAVALDSVAGSLAGVGLTPDRVPDDFDLMEGGVIDSLGFLELISAIEEAFGIEVDYEDLEPEVLTVIGPLSRFVAERAVALEGERS